MKFEIVYFRRSPSAPMDRLQVPAGTAASHVRPELIAKIVPDTLTRPENPALRSISGAYVWPNGR